MNYTQFFVFTIIAQLVLYGMEPEKKQSLISSVTSTIKSIASAVLSSPKISKIDKHPHLQLASLLQHKLKEITLLKSGRKIEVTDRVATILKKHAAVYYGTDKSRKYTFANNSNISIKEGIYFVRNDSSLTVEYPITEIFTYSGSVNYTPIVSFKAAHHIALCTKLEIKNGSIFEPHFEVKTPGYDLDIIYENDQEKTSWAFALKENNAEICDSPGFINHEKRIKYYTELTNPTIQDLIDVKRR